MNKHAKLLQELLDEARGLKGMIAEVACKCRLLTQNVQLGTSVSEEESLEQMEIDLDKYSERFNQIIEEFSTYGIVPKLE